MSTSSVVLITGASSGFGRLSALRLARAGHTVYAGMRDPGGRNAAAKAELEGVAAAEGLRLSAVALDVCSDASVEGAVAGVMAEAGRIDVLLNNAGVMYVGIAESFSAAQLADQLDTNLVGAFRVTRAVLPGMRARGRGLLLHVSSVFGRLAGPFCGLYNATKYGMEGLFAAIHQETHCLGIDTVMIEPGPFRTNIGLSGAQAADAATVIPGYGPVGQAFGMWAAGFGQFMAQPIPELDPELFASAVLELVEAPHGQRPLRKVIGLTYGADQLNALAAPFEAGIVQMQQLGFLLERPGAGGA